MSTLCCHKSYNLHKSTTKNSITIKYIPFFITLNAHPTIKANKKFCFTYTLTNGLTRIISHILLSCFLIWRQDLMAKRSHQHLQQFECTNLIGGSLCKGFLIGYSSKRKSHITNITLVVHSAFPTLVLPIQVPHFKALCTWTNYVLEYGNPLYFIERIVRACQCHHLWHWAFMSEGRQLNLGRNFKFSVHPWSGWCLGVSFLAMSGMMSRK